MTTRESRPLLPLTTVAALAALVGAPFAFIILQAIFPDIAQGSFGHPLSGARRAMLDRSTLEAALHSLALGTCVAFGALLVGIPLGAARAMTRMPLARVFDIMLLAPFMIPPYINALAWILLLQRGGWLDQLTGFSASAFIFSFWGVVFVMALNLFPIVYFATSRAVASAGGRLFDVARVFGATAPRAFLRIVAPLAAPAILGALLLVFSAAIEEFGAPDALASGRGFFVIATAINRRVGDFPVDLQSASALSLILAAMALVAFFAQDRATARRPVETIIGKPRETEARARRPLFALAVTGFALSTVMAVVAPLGSIAAGATTRTLSGGLKAGNFTLANFAALGTDADGALEAVGASFALAATAALLTAALGLAAALCLARRDSSGRLLRGLVALLSVLPNATPGIVVSVGLILFWNQPALPATVYGTWLMLPLAYGCVLLPYPVRYAEAALRQIGSTLEPAARVAGASPMATLLRITLPLIAPSLCSAALLVFAIASRELVASTLLAPIGGQTISTFIWREFEQGSLGEGMAMSLTAIAVTTGALSIVFAIASQGRRGVRSIRQF